MFGVITVILRAPYHRVRRGPAHVCRRCLTARVGIPPLPWSCACRCVCSVTAEHKVEDLGLGVLPAAEFIKQACRVCIHAIQAFGHDTPCLPSPQARGWGVACQASGNETPWGLASGKGRASFRDANIRFLPSFLVDAAAASIRAAPSPWRRPPRRNRHSGLAKMLPTSAKSPVAGRIGEGDEA